MRHRAVTPASSGPVALFLAAFALPPAAGEAQVEPVGACGGVRHSPYEFGFRRVPDERDGRLLLRGLP